MAKPPNQAERESQKIAWAKSRGLKEYRGGSYLGLRFLNHGMPSHFEYTRFPAQDHTTYWKKDGKPYCIVSQPYHVDDAEMEAVIKMAKQWGLEVTISGMPAWHYPGGVLHMEWKQRGQMNQ